MQTYKCTMTAQRGGIYVYICICMIRMPLYSTISICIYVYMSTCICTDTYTWIRTFVTRRYNVRAGGLECSFMSSSLYMCVHIFIYMRTYTSIHMEHDDAALGEEDWNEFLCHYLYKYLSIYYTNTSIRIYATWQYSMGARGLEWISISSSLFIAIHICIYIHTRISNICTQHDVQRGGRRTGMNFYVIISRSTFGELPNPRHPHPLPTHPHDQPTPRIHTHQPYTWVTL